MLKLFLAKTREQRLILIIKWLPATKIFVMELGTL